MIIMNTLTSLMSLIMPSEQHDILFINFYRILKKNGITLIEINLCVGNANPQTRALSCKWEESRGVEIETHGESF